MNKYFLLLLLAVSLLTYSCGGGGSEKKEADTEDTSKEEETKKDDAPKEEEKPKEAAELVVGKWSFVKEEVAPSYMETKTSEIRSQIEKELKEQNEERAGEAIEFFKSKDFKMYDKYGKEEVKGTYELKADGQDLEMNDGEYIYTYKIKSLTESEMVVEISFETDTDKVPYTFYYKKA